MTKKTEYVFGWTDCLIQYATGDIDCDVDGLANKRQADKEIKNEVAGLNDDIGVNNLAWVRKYTWDDGDLLDDEDYWINPAIVSEGQGGYQ